MLAYNFYHPNHKALLSCIMLTFNVDEQKIAFVTELHQLSDRARSLELFPEKLDVEIETDEGVQVLNLVKQKSLNVRSIPFQYDVPELNKREFKLVKVRFNQKEYKFEIHLSPVKCP